MFAENPVSADFTDRMLGVFDKIFRSVETTLDHFARYLDPMSTPAERDPRTLTDFLAWLASWMGVILDRSWDERRRRLFLRDAHIFHQLRGTLEGLRRQLLLYLGWTDTEQAGRARAGPSRRCSSSSTSSCAGGYSSARRGSASNRCSGESASSTAPSSVRRAQAGGTQLIGTQDPDARSLSRLRAQVLRLHPRGVRETAMRAARCVERLISLGKPAHTAHQLEFVEPRFRIGIQATIGLDSVVGRYPQGSKLDEHRLGYDTVMGKAQDESPTLQVGTQSRIGTTTILD